MTCGESIPVRLGGHHHHTGRSRPPEHVLQALDEQEVAQVADLEGGLQAILRQAPGLSANGCVADQDVQGAVRGGAFKHI